MSKSSYETAVIMRRVSVAYWTFFLYNQRIFVIMVFFGYTLVANCFVVIDGGKSAQTKNKKFSKKTL